MPQRGFLSVCFSVYCLRACDVCLFLTSLYTPERDFDFRNPAFREPPRAARAKKGAADTARFTARSLKLLYNAADCAPTLDTPHRLAASDGRENCPSVPSVQDDGLHGAAAQRQQELHVAKADHQADAAVRLRQPLARLQLRESRLERGLEG